MMRYLSVHDLVWIDATVTGASPTFGHDDVEACMAAQYGYGNSTDVMSQAASLLETLLRVRPFGDGNVRAAYVATIAFLLLNAGRLRLTADQAADTVARVASGALDARAAIEDLAEPGGTAAPVGSVRPLVTSICNDHSDALRRLTGGD